MVRETNFGSYLFTAADLIDLIGISKPTFHSLIKSGVLEPKTVKSGSVSKKMYDWNDLVTLATRYSDRIQKPKRRIKVFCNLKGGVGKTSLSSNFAMQAAAWGLKTLLIDADPQWNTSLVFGINSEAENPKTLYDLFRGDSFSDVILKICPTLDLIPSSLRLSKAEMLLRQKNNGQMRLSMLLSSIKDDYDLIVIDTNPSLLFLNINAFLAADELCIVSETELFSVSGMTSMFEVIDELSEDYPDFQPSIRIIPNIFDIRESSCQMAVGALREHYSEFTTTAVVRKSVDFKEAQNAAQAVFFHKKKSNASQDIEYLARELLNDGNVASWDRSAEVVHLPGVETSSGDAAHV